jgi:predicted Fe-Mo cluster-binding NifX family protein
MKILITSKSNNENSEVDSRFGRCIHFALVDMDNGQIEFHDNSSNASGRQGAGVGAGKLASDLGAEYLLTGNCGPNAYKTLEAAGIKVIVGVSGTLKDAIQYFKDGKYTAINKPNVDGHW